jgi:hypothetical protein
MQPRVYVYEGLAVTVEVDELGQLLAAAPVGTRAATHSALAAAATNQIILCRIF